MPKPQKPSASGNKRKDVSESTNDKSSPPKKRCRKKCSAEGCTNIVVKGEVCIRHGATWTKKKCRSEGCTKYAQNGKVCITHGATWTKKRCIINGCTNSRRKGGVCYKHRNNLIIAPSPQLCRDVQGESNQINESTVTEISDDEGERESSDGKWKSKDQVSTSKVALRRSDLLKTNVNYNEDDDTDAMLDSVNEMEKDEAEVANPKHDDQIRHHQRGQGGGRMERKQTIERKMHQMLHRYKRARKNYSKNWMTEETGGTMVKTILILGRKIMKM